MNRMILHTILLCCMCMASCSDNEENRPVLPPDQEHEEPETPDKPQNNSPLTTSSTVRDVIEHEAFSGFGQFILPAERSYDNNMRLADVARLLPFHNYVTGERAVETINKMIDYVSDGNRLFYDIYSDAKKRADSRKNNTGLFFFRGEPGRPFAIVCPGGGFSYVGAIHEGFPLAIALSEMGYNAFSIQYRTGGAQVACEDLAQAIDFIMRHAEELRVSTENYSLWGGSAGARMAAYL